MNPDIWNPELYLKFKEERTQPSIDLAARLTIVNPARIIDIGCGPGNSTRVLKQRFPGSEITGLDSSPEMIEKARHYDDEVNWICANAFLYDYEGRYDVIFSNATLQWIPDHDQLLERLLDHLAPGGMMAVQVPGNQQSPLQVATREIASLSEWGECFTEPLNSLHYKEPEYYYDVLTRSKSKLDFSLWITTYLHVLDSLDAILQWYRSTGMKPYLAALTSDDRRKRFIELIREKLLVDNAYPKTGDGKVIFPFRRVFFTARKYGC